MPLPSLIVFGPQTRWPNSEYLSQLRRVLLLEPRLGTIVEAIENLTDLWMMLEEKDKRLNQVQGLKSIAILRRWLNGEDLPLARGEQPNTLTLPMTVIVHLVQYLYYFDNDVDYPSQPKILENVEQGGIQGFCAGFLAAVAVSCSQNEEEVTNFGAVALRQALCIGAYVDLDSALNLDTICLAVRWRSNTGHDRVREIIRSYPDAYISVIVDETDLTVTVPKDYMAALSQELTEEGMSVMSIGLEGRYHSSTNDDAMNRVLAFCTSQSGLSFPDARALRAPVRSNFSAELITEGSLNRHAIQCIMYDLTDWRRTISLASSDIFHLKDATVLSFGTTRAVPLAAIKQGGLRVVEARSWTLLPRRAFGDKLAPSISEITPPVAKKNNLYGENAVAVVGMACKFPGADSLDDFWRLLTEGTSMMEEMPAERFSTKSLRRTPDGKFRFFGNFVRNIMAFDHRFFKKSSREAASMDPQQRLMLQCAYAALESSGHFGKLSNPFPNDIGCFIGVCTNDYNDNVASHNPNAYSSLGTLRAFIAGKISHYFGWSGPSITFDTACSSSAVAIHDACRSLQGGECSQAVAGGINLFTTPYFYENLVSASFLSPTGQTKPFDAKADGYCRGEGAGLVVLKKLSTAIADGDNVMGVISASAINQNSNTVGITVPHSPSQAALYTRVTSLAGVDPKSVSYVEAHGTGTPVGDPREIASIRQVFGGAKRADPLYVSSVKGNIGHLEAASGIASLIKTLLMIKNNVIPVQASFDSLNPAIPALEPDRLIIPVSNQGWDAKLKVACINNYGASGSNATMVVCEPPAELSRNHEQIDKMSRLGKYPIFVSANSSASLAANCAAIEAQCTRLSSKFESQELLASLAYNLAIKQNQALPHVLATSAASLPEFNDLLIAARNDSSSQVSQVPSKPKPVVLVFGGQVNDAVGLSKEIYDSSIIFRSYLDQCDVILRSFGLKGLYPEIFQTSPVTDIVSLQSMVFALQYSCSKAWIDSGLKIEAVIGHSLGQYAAMCIAGTFSLKEGLKLTSGRASLMQKHWGPESGSMLAIEIDGASLLKLLSRVNADDPDGGVEIACFNGPTSHVLVGREASITKTQKILREDKSFGTALIKSKRLNVTQGFHSVFTEPLLPSLKTLARELAFKAPTIHLETCSDGQSWECPNPQLIAEHTRTPVYFGQAIERLAERLGPCTWLEVGSASSVIGMVRRALDPATTAQHTFQPAQLSSTGAMEFLADSTVNLWKWGHQVHFWPYHKVQKDHYTSLNLPPYQFEKTTHWLDWKEPSGATTTTTKSAVPLEPLMSEDTLMIFIGYRDQNKREAEFSVNPRSTQWRAHVSGHAVLAEPLCPAPMYVELSTRGAKLLHTDGISGLHIPFVEAIEIKAPLGLAQDRIVTMIMTELESLSWKWEIVSQPQDQKVLPIGHATGRISLQVEGPRLLDDFSRYEKLICYDRFDALKSDPNSEALQGKMVYKVFSKVVNYGDWYKGVTSVFSRGGEAIGRVAPPAQSIDGLAEMVTSPLALDSFIQVSGLHVNSLNECGPGQVFVCTKLDRIQTSPHFKADHPETRCWDVFTNFSRPGEKSVSNDIFVFNSVTRELVMIILGAFFTRVPINSLAKVLSKANSRTSGPAVRAPSGKEDIRNLAVVLPPVRSEPVVESAKPRRVPAQADNPGTKAKTTVEANLRNIIHHVAEVPIEDLKDDASLENLGVDSLMVTEVAGEIGKFFKIEINPHDFETLVDIRSLGNYLLSRGVGGGEYEGDSSSGSSVETTPPTTSSASSVHTVSDDTVDRLAKLLAVHLETSESFEHGANLAAHGLDSLMCMELASDIKRTFGTELDMHRINDESTFGDLCDMVTFLQSKPEPALAPADAIKSISRTKHASVETIVYKQSGNLSLEADIYYPSQVSEAKRPVALLIHGGGHCLYSRKDVNRKQIRVLLTKGFLPVSVDYRFCPETTLLEGPMRDVCDALRWVRHELPRLELSCPGLNIDGDRVAVVGWSTGGTLAMSLGFTPRLHGIKPPEAILAFYCPSNYDHECFKNPIYPGDAIDSPHRDYDLLASVRDQPFTSYTPSLNKGNPGTFMMGLADERWRLILHMNWKAQMVPILINGLPTKKSLAGRDAKSFYNMPMPSPEQIAAISPYAQIQRGIYRTPTFIMHGTDDDLVPCCMSRETIAALQAKGVECGIACPEGAKHLFDTFPSEDPTGTGVAAVKEGYEFLWRQFSV